LIRTRFGVGRIYKKGSRIDHLMITDSNQACLAKMTGRRVQEVLNEISLCQFFEMSRRGVVLIIIRKDFLDMFHARDGIIVGDEPLGPDWGKYLKNSLQGFSGPPQCCPGKSLGSTGAVEYPNLFSRQFSPCRGICCKHVEQVPRLPVARNEWV